MKMLQYGVYSASIGCGSPIDIIPDFYTNVGFYIPWILDNMD